MIKGEGWRDINYIHFRRLLFAVSTGARDHHFRRCVPNPDMGVSQGCSSNLMHVICHPEFHLPMLEQTFH